MREERESGTHPESRCITTSPFDTHHCLPKINRAKTMARDNENIRWFSHLGLFWHPHKAVSLGGDDPVTLQTPTLSMSRDSISKKLIMKRQFVWHTLNVQPSEVNQCYPFPSTRPTPAPTRLASKTQLTSRSAKKQLSGPSRCGP